MMSLLFSDMTQTQFSDQNYSIQYHSTQCLDTGITHMTSFCLSSQVWTRQFEEATSVHFVLEVTR